MSISAWFVSVNALIEPKPISSLVDLWDHMFQKQATKWHYLGSKPQDLKASLDELLAFGAESGQSDEVRALKLCFVDALHLFQMSIALFFILILKFIPSKHYTARKVQNFNFAT